MNPFAYPKTKHARSFSPKQYKRYQTYKRILRLEFSGKCVYCQMPSSMRGYGSFGVDHYRPKKHFPQLGVSYGNLYYCCHACNSNKGDYWPSAHLLFTQFIPNPCDHVMFSHLRFNGAVVEEKSKAGAIAREILDLNDPESVSYREFVIGTIELWRQKRADLESKRAKVARLLRSRLIPPADAESANNEIDSELQKVDKNLALLSGSSV